MIPAIFNTNKPIQMILQEKWAKPVNVIPNASLFPITVSEILVHLKSRGYELKFRRETTCLYCMELNHWITPDSFIVDEYYHFEDSLNTDSNRTLYAISSLQGFKGYLVDTCFVYEDNISMEMMQKLSSGYHQPLTAV